VKQKEAAQRQRFRLDMLEPGQFVAETNGTIEQAARCYVDLEVMCTIAQQQMLVATRALQDGRQTLEMADIESIAIAASYRQCLGGQDRGIPVGSPENAGVGERADWRLGESATPNHAPPRRLTR